MPLHDMNFSSLHQNEALGYLVEDAKCWNGEPSSAKCVFPVICLSQPQTYSPILASVRLAQDSENCLSPLPVDLVSQQGASAARRRRGLGEGTSCLLTVPLTVTAPTVVFCALCSRNKLSKLASSNWLLQELGGLWA